MIEVIYSEQRAGFEPGAVYRNPRYFERPMAAGVSKVTIIGHWPKVAEAYRAIGIEAEHTGELPKPGDPVPDPDPSKPEDPVVEQSAAHPSDAEMREAIKQATGKAPGPRTSRENLIAQYEALGD